MKEHYSLNVCMLVSPIVDLGRGAIYGSLDTLECLTTSRFAPILSRHKKLVMS